MSDKCIDCGGTSGLHTSACNQAEYERSLEESATLRKTLATTQAELVEYKEIIQRLRDQLESIHNESEEIHGEATSKLQAELEKVTEERDSWKTKWDDLETSSMFDHVHARRLKAEARVKELEAALGKADELLGVINLMHPNLEHLILWQETWRLIELALGRKE